MIQATLGEQCDDGNADGDVSAGVIPFWDVAGGIIQADGGCDGATANSLCLQDCSFELTATTHHGGDNIVIAGLTFGSSGDGSAWLKDLSSGFRLSNTVCLKAYACLDNDS